MANHLRSSNKDPRYYRHNSSPSLSRNLYSVVLIEDGGFSKEDEQTRVKYILNSEKIELLVFFTRTHY